MSVVSFSSGPKRRWYGHGLMLHSRFPTPFLPHKQEGSLKRLLKSLRGGEEGKNKIEAEDHIFKIRKRSLRCRRIAAVLWGNQHIGFNYNIRISNSISKAGVWFSCNRRTMGFPASDCCVIFKWGHGCFMLPCFHRGLKLLHLGGAASRMSSMGGVWSSWTMTSVGFEVGGADGLEGSACGFLGQAEGSCVWMFPRVEVVCPPPRLIKWMAEAETRSGWAVWEAVVDPERYPRCDIYTAVVLLCFSLVWPQFVRAAQGLPGLIAKCFHCCLLLLVEQGCYSVGCDAGMLPAWSTSLDLHISVALCVPGEH